jgi:haloalkane dehalogenase
MNSVPQQMAVPRILFASPCGPYPKTPVERDPVDFFYYRNTLGQGIFRLRSFQSWYSLHFLAQNLPVPSVVLENPSMKQFQHEVSRGHYQAVAIDFTVITAARVLAMVSWLKQTYPAIDVILGGYGTSVFKDPDANAARLQAQVDYICFGEGLEFMRRYIDERWGIRQNLPLRQDFIPMQHCFFRTSLTIFTQLVFVGSLGCTFGCSFCATSSQFDRRRIPIASGGELFKHILAQARRYPNVKSAIVYDEDFLIDRSRVLEFMRLMESSAELRKRPFLLTVFASVRSVRQYSMSELIRCGIGTIYIGIESFQPDVLERESLVKRDGDVEAIFEELHQHGICTLGSLIIGWDEQTSAQIQQEIERFITLNPTFYQVVPLHPIPGTGLWKRLKEQQRFLEGYTFEKDSIAQFTFVLQNVSRDEALGAVTRTYRGLVAEGGPWPFRIFENLLRGYQHLSTHPDPVMISRAQACRKLLRPLLPLAILSRIFFAGPGFRKRWRSTIQMTLREYPILAITGGLGALLAFPFLAVLYLFANVRFWARPSGDQPKVIRRDYAGRLHDRRTQSVLPDAQANAQAL